MAEHDFFTGSAGRKTRLLQEGVWPDASGWDFLFADRAGQKDFFSGPEGKKTSRLQEGVWPGASGWTNATARKSGAKLFPSKPLVTGVPVSSEAKTDKSPAYTRLLGRIRFVELGETRFTLVLREICAVKHRGLLLDGEAGDLYNRLRDAVAASKKDGVLSEPTPIRMRRNGSGIPHLPFNRCLSYGLTLRDKLPMPNDGRNTAPRESKSVIILPCLTHSIPNLGCISGERVTFATGKQRRLLVKR